MNGRRAHLHVHVAPACVRARGRDAGARRADRAPAAGFTLVELILVLVVVGVIAVVAVARMPSQTIFQHQAAMDELASALRYAQKKAVAERAAVDVRIDTAAGTVTFCRDPAPACAQPLLAPGDTAALRVAVPAGVTLSVAPAGTTRFAFDGLGRIADVAAQQARLDLVSGGVTAQVVAWVETGLVETGWSTP